MPVPISLARLEPGPFEGWKTGFQSGLDAMVKGVLAAGSMMSWSQVSVLLMGYLNG